MPYCVGWKQVTGTAPTLEARITQGVNIRRPASGGGTLKSVHQSQREDGGELAGYCWGAALSIVEAGGKWERICFHDGAGRGK